MLLHYITEKKEGMLWYVRIQSCHFDRRFNRDEQQIALGLN